MPYGASVIDLDFKKQTSQNLYDLMNGQHFDISKFFQCFNDPYMLHFFNVYQEFGCEAFTFLQCVLTTIGDLSDGITLSNVISHSVTSLNSMTHIIAEPDETHFITVILLCIVYRFTKK